MKEDDKNHQAAAAFVSRVRAAASDTAAKSDQPVTRSSQPQLPAGITINRPSRCTIVIGAHPAPQQRTKRARKA